MQVCRYYLAGYGSGSDSDSDGGMDAPPAVHGAASVVAAPKTAAGGLFSSLPRPKSAAPPTAAGAASASASGLPSGFFDAEPAPVDDGAPPSLPAGFFDTPSTAAAAATTTAPPSVPSAAADAAQLFSKLPAASKRKVLLRPQIDLQLLAQQSDSDEDEPVAKKIKAAAPAAGKPSILSFLPAPKNTQASTGQRMDLGGGGSFAEAAKQRKQQQQQQLEEQQAAAAAAGPAAPASNEAYRLSATAGAAAAAAASYPDYQDYNQYQQQYEQHQGYGQAQDYHYAAAGAYGAGNSSGAAVQQDYAQYQHHQPQQQLPAEEAFLQEALQAEASKAAKRAAGAGSSQLLMPNIQFKEVKADEVKYVDPAQREATQGMRSALGTDYAQQLRAQAAPHTGSKLARSKHQIGTLFANAKLRELEVMENRASGMKSKAETAGKYGWS